MKAPPPTGKPVIFATILTLCEEGDEVIYPDPGFPAYSTTIEYVGAKAVPLPVYGCFMSSRPKGCWTGNPFLFAF